MLEEHDQESALGELVDDNGTSVDVPLVYSSRPPVSGSIFINTVRGGQKQRELTPEEHRQSVAFTGALEEEEAERRAAQLKQLSNRMRSSLRPIFHVLKFMTLFALVTLLFWIGTLIVLVNPRWRDG